MNERWRLPQRGGLAALIILIALAPSGPAVAGPAPETALTAGSAAEFATAVAVFSADNSGPHAITITAGFTISASSEPVYTGTQPLTIDGQGFAIDGGGNSRILDSQSAALLTVKDVTMRNGRIATAGLTDAVGGAIEADGSVAVVNSTFSGNVATSDAADAQGGAVHAGLDVAVTNAAFVGNVAESTVAAARGGAIDAGDEIDLTNATLEDNTATSGNTSSGVAAGGAVHADQAVTVLRSLLTANKALGWNGGGGAIRVPPGGQITVTDSTLTANVAGQGNPGTGEGGALHLCCGAGSISVTNSTLSENVATGIGVARGGAIMGHDVTLDHTTVVRNLANGLAGLTSGENLLATGVLAAKASVLAEPLLGPSVGDCDIGGSTVSDGYNVEAGISCGFTDGSDQQSVVYALVGPARDNGSPPTMYPLAGSPVVDAIPAIECGQGTDQRGLARPFPAGGRCDIGATEQVYPAHSFGDVPPWIEPAVRWITSTVNTPQIMTGVTPTVFDPKSNMTRAQLVRAIYRVAGSPPVAALPAHGLPDVPAWVEDAVRWAMANNVIAGDNGFFKPNDPITRAQVTRINYRLAGSPPVAALPTHNFTDVPPWVEDAVRWAANPNNPVPIMTGFTPTTFKPNAPITRGAIARKEYRLAISPGAWADYTLAPSTVPFIAP